MHIRKILLGTVAAAAMSVSAHAAPANGTSAGSIVGISATAGSIGVGTTFTNTIFTVFASGTGDLAAGDGLTVTLSPVTATLGSLVTFSGAAFGSFTGNVAAPLSATGPASSRVVDIYVLGTYTPGTAIPGFTAGPASLTFSFTQTGSATGAVSGSFTMASPPAPPPGVPAPAALALFGLALAGLGVATRARKA